MKKTALHLRSITDALSRFFSVLLIGIIRFYQFAISPLLGSNCRHMPTCSNYMLEAIKIWGPLKGSWLGLKRIGKCHPWGTSGYDPVPKKVNEKTEEN
ncbi:MAG: membrane protein insertion efficiency factor YidD [Balneolaceae bacterium]|nr:MAG: membrane protein insertion efficiency factor YidD [Balneolaceae bacterium]